MGSDQSPDIVEERTGDALHQELVAESVEVFLGATGPTPDSELGDPLELLGGGRSPQGCQYGPHGFVRSDLEVPHSVAVKGYGGVALDDRAVEVEEGTDPPTPWPVANLA
jgi:hypothetical protein